MDARTYLAHTPALSLQEAAMLPALPRNMLIPTRGLDFRRGAVDGMPQPSVRRGTMAGRALLTYVKSAPAQRRRR